ncbi:hypothetical protein Csa_018733 [Cucumis sativus]|uniref:Uncharacterized protein n=1 Tax=Cucumis sativus TaxID=3659 RepID=A0A0A0LQK1_CUCSA|nr:hypothetical protein Csa_018733 [Cucumis sativus]
MRQESSGSNGKGIINSQENQQGFRESGDHMNRPSADPRIACPISLIFLLAMIMFLLETRALKLGGVMKCLIPSPDWLTLISFHESHGCGG